MQARLVDDRKTALTRTVRMLCSDASVDRHGTRLNQQGWVLDNYRRNPVVLWSHDKWGFPVGRAVTIEVTERGLEMDIQFATVEEYPAADTCYRLLKGGFLNMGSVGFYPVGDVTEDADGTINFAGQELFEFSIVTVGSNVNALVTARAAGIDLAPLTRALDAAPTSHNQELRQALLLAQKVAVPAALNRARRQVDVNRNTIANA
jgi:HK97 family phage prohead protease